MNVNGLWVEMDVVIQLLVYRIGGGDYVYIIVSKLCVGVCRGEWSQCAVLGD